MFVSRGVAALSAALLAVLMAGCAADEPETDQPAGPTPPEQQLVAGSVWVADETGNSLTVIDAAANEVATTLTGIGGPHNVQVGQDGATVYATSVGTDLVVAVDADTYQVTATAPTGPHPAHVIEAPDGRVYVANQDDGTVSIYEAKSLRPLGQIEVGGMPHGLRAAADGSVIVVANHMTGALDLIDPRTDEVMGSVPVGEGPAQVAVSADGRYAYTGITAPAEVVKVDLDERAVVGRVEVPAAPVQVYLTPDDATVISADQGTEEAPGDTASLIDTATMTVAAGVSTGAGPHGVVIDPTGAAAWITDSYDNTVSVIDVSAQSVVATVPVGDGPNGISYSPRPPAPGAATIALDLPEPEPGTHHGEQPHAPGHR